MKSQVDPVSSGTSKTAPTGQQYDGTGMVESWWTEDDQSAFDERAQCFVEQYNAYEVPEITTPGIDNNVRANGRPPDLRTQPTRVGCKVEAQ